MATTWADVEALAPQLSTVAAGAQTLILGYVNAVLDTASDAWGDAEVSALAGALLAAHFGALAAAQSSSGASGPVTSMSLGQASKSFAVPSLSMDAGALGATAYGAQYLELAKTTFSGGMLL